MHAVIERVRIILTAAVVWLTVLGLVLGIVADELAEAIGVESPVVGFLLRVVAMVGVGISILVRVTPVLPGARGILPPPAGVPVTPDEAALAGRLHAAQRVPYAGNHRDETHGP